jgi:hypothetical protein
MFGSGSFHFGHFVVVCFKCTNVSCSLATWLCPLVVVFALCKVRDAESFAVLDSRTVNGGHACALGSLGGAEVVLVTNGPNVTPLPFSALVSKARCVLCVSHCSWGCEPHP